MSVRSFAPSCGPLLSVLALTCTLSAQAPPQIPINAPLARTPERLIDKMLEIANVSSGDTLYDLGSGDGRIVIRAALKRKARGVGIEIDPQITETARTSARMAGVAHLVSFQLEDIFNVDLRHATVVTLFLLPEVNLALRDKLQALKPGTRVVGHTFDMGGWKPDRSLRYAGTTVYLWVVK